MTRARLLVFLLAPLDVLGALAVLPLVALGAGAMAAGLIGGLVSNKKAKKYQPVQYDKINAPDRALYNYGGSAGYADEQRQQLANMREYYGQRNLLGGGDNGGLTDYRGGLAQYRSALAQQGQTREQQQALATMLASQARGEGPSLAGEQMRAGTEQAALNALNIAATQRGGGPGATMSALDSNAMAAQRANRDAAMARIQEINDARGQYGALLGGIRSQDQAAMQAGQEFARLGLSQQQVGLSQQALALQQAGLNDAQIRALMEHELAVNAGQLQGSMAYGGAAFDVARANQAAQLQSGLAAQGLNAQAYEDYQGRNNALWGGLIQGGASSMALAAQPRGGFANLDEAAASPGYQAMVDRKYQQYMGR